MENKCKICNKDLGLSMVKHYIARDNDITGLAVLAKSEEVTLYDAFDCPNCGCQNIMQERKRYFVPKYESIEQDDIDSEDDLK